MFVFKYNCLENWSVGFLGDSMIHLVAIPVAVWDDDAESFSAAAYTQKLRRRLFPNWSAA